MQNDKTVVIVGLGNPGERYCQTLHNVGFKVVDELASKNGWLWKTAKEFQTQVAKGMLSQTTYHLLKPQTYMNLSGMAVRSYLAYYQIPAANLLVVVDDADLPFGHMRMRPFGGSGGQKGLENIKKELLTDQFKRLKMGIGRPSHLGVSLADFVLTPQANERWDELKPSIAKAVLLLEKLASQPFDTVMNEANTLIRRNE